MLIHLSTWSCLNIRMQDEVTVRKIDNSCSGRAEDFKYVGTNLRNQNCIQVENKSRLKSGHVQNILSSSFLFKNFKINI